jgi:chromosome segregation ATPase
MSDPNVFEELGFPRDEAADLLRQSDARIIDELRERVSALNRRIDALQKAKPTFLTDYQRMWDLVRHQRAALVDAGLITALEYALLVSHESTVTNAAGSPSPRRLESYDELRAKLAEVEAERDQLRHSWGAAARTVRALREELECGSDEESLPKLQAFLATLTAERKRAERAEQERDDALRLMATARDENRWLEAYGRVEAERDEARDGGARLHSRMVALEATLTAERERADRAERVIERLDSELSKPFMEFAALLTRAEAAEAENARLRAAITSLLVRVRPNSEAAAWVVDELRAALAPPPREETPR